jgi:hypothetical protein
MSEKDELKKAHRLLSQMIGRQRECEIEKARLKMKNIELMAEIERLKGGLIIDEVQR